MRLTVVHAPPIDREKLRVRINEQDKPSGINWYDYVEIKVIETGKLIVCKLHGNDIPNIKSRGEKSLIYINEPLRDRLGRIKVKEILDFEIKKKHKGFFINWYYFVRYHPDDTVVVATWLGIIAVLISIVFGLISLIKVFCN